MMTKNLKDNLSGFKVVCGTLGGLRLVAQVHSDDREKSVAVHARNPLTSTDQLGFFPTDSEEVNGHEGTVHDLELDFQDGA